MKKVLIALIIVAAVIFTGCSPVILGQDEQKMDEDEQIVLAQDVPAQPTTNQVDTDSQSEQDDNQDSTLEDLIIPEDMEWHENYPLNILPLFPDGEIELADASANQMSYRSDYSLYDVTVYYFDILVAADDFKIVDKQDYDKFFGTIDSYYFEVTCTKEDTPGSEGKEYSTLITVKYTTSN